MSGVSIDFFGAAIRHLSKKYGERLSGPRMEEFRAALALAEELFVAMPKSEAIFPIDTEEVA